MKNLFNIFLLIQILAFSQETPQGISYQAVAYDSDGFEISNQDISVRLGILLGGVDAEASYTEVHSVTTDDFGLFSLVISQGETSNTFSSINWEEGAYLKVEVDEDLDGVYTLMGVSSFNAVPYALNAPTEYRIDSLLNIFNDKFYLMSLDPQYALNQGYTPYDLMKVGREKNSLYGLEYEGGIIFYLDTTGTSGKVFSLTDIGNYTYNDFPIWGCYGQYITGADSDFGFYNTLNFLSQCSEPNSAAYLCSTYSNEGYVDWYLPSVVELQLIYQNVLDLTNKYLSTISDEYLFYSDFHENFYYWSSNQEANNPNAEAYLFNLYNGQLTYWAKVNTGSQSRVRAVRSF